jgi:shikimate kinase
MLGNRDMENIILVGYMGSGKTSVGQDIASIKGYTFVDTDKMIEENEKRTISDIFATEGEEAFRDMETRLLENLISQGGRGLVISTGGGMPLRNENRRLLAQLGRVVYLRALPATIYERIKEDKTRPLLQCADPQSKIKEMIALRGPLYEKSAAIVIDVDNLSQSEVGEEIIRRMER